MEFWTCAIVHREFELVSTSGSSTEGYLSDFGMGIHKTLHTISENIQVFEFCEHSSMNK